MDYRQEGESFWSRFTGGKQGTLWYYRALLKAFGEKRSQPLVQEIKAARDRGSIGITCNLV
jgi:GTP pyrophosphokinase